MRTKIWAKLFGVVQKVKEVNAKRLRKAPGRAFSGASFSNTELKSPSISLDYIIAPPSWKQLKTEKHNIRMK